jgi:PAS domain S-box-containing protein
MDAARSRQIKAKAEAAMHHLAAIVESSDEAIYSKNLDSIIISWNPAAERIFGYRAEEIIGHSIARLFPVNQRDELLDIMAGIRRSEMVGFKETYRKRKDGRIIPVSVTISPIKGNDGRVIGASTIARDITEKKQTDNERHKLIEELTRALQHVKALSGLLPICTCCKSIRDDGGYWQAAETYIRQHADVTFSQTLCPECEMKHFPESSIRRLR